MAGDSLEWFPWYWKDWRLSGAYRRLSGTERGIYRELLDECWAEDGFTLDPPALARLCAVSEAEFRAAWARLVPQFKQTAGGIFYNAQMQKIKVAQVGKREALAERGRKGGHAKALAQAQHKQPQALAERERQKDSLSRGQNGADPAGQSRRLPDPLCEHGYWGEVSGRPRWFCTTCPDLNLRVLP